MNHRGHFEALGRRPVLHGLDGTYGGVVAYLLGFDAATAGGLLSGFREWLTVRLGEGDNLAWPALTRRAVARECGHAADGSTCAGCEEAMVSALFALLDEFLSDKESQNGVVRIFDAYLEWLKGQEWYRPEVLGRD